MKIPHNPKPSFFVPQNPLSFVLFRSPPHSWFCVIIVVSNAIIAHCLFYLKVSIVINWYNKKAKSYCQRSKQLFRHKTHPKLSYIIEVIVAKTFSKVAYGVLLCFGSYNCYYVKYPLIQRSHPNIQPHFELIMNIPAFLHCFYKCFFSFITTRLLVLKNSLAKDICKAPIKSKKANKSITFYLSA